MGGHTRVVDWSCVMPRGKISAGELMGGAKWLGF